MTIQISAGDSDHLVKQEVVEEQQQDLNMKPAVAEPVPQLLQPQTTSMEGEQMSGGLDPAYGVTVNVGPSGLPAKVKHFYTLN